MRSQKKVKLVSSVIGDRVKIGLASRIIKCVVMSDVVIGDNCTVQNSIICAGAVIEKGEVLRVYRYYMLCDSCSQFDSLLLASLTGRKNKKAAR